MKTTVEKMREPIRILVVDDHPTVRQRLGRLLEPEGIMVCAEASNCAEALASAKEQQFDMALVDLSLGDEDGISLIADLDKQALPSLAYSIHEDEHHVKRALAAGALGYVTKSEVHLVLVDAIFEVAGGCRFISPKAAMVLDGQAENM